MPAPLVPQPPRRSQVEVLIAQIEAIDRYHRYRARGASAARPTSRELRLDAQRREDVLQRQHHALVARVAEQLAQPPGPLLLSFPLRAVLAHRSPWFVERLTEALSADDIEVVATTANGADAVGLVVAEQPEIVLLEDHLEMMVAEQVVRVLHELCPDVRLAVQVESQEDVAGMLEAGACAVVTRQVPPAEVATRLVELLVPPPAAAPLVAQPPARLQPPPRPAGLSAVAPGVLPQPRTG